MALLPYGKTGDIMARIAKALAELRAKYGLNPDTGLAPAKPPPPKPVEPVIITDRFIEPPRRQTSHIVKVDPLALIVIALKAMADYTQRDDLRPQYRELANEIERMRLEKR